MSFGRRATRVAIFVAAGLGTGGRLAADDSRFLIGAEAGIFEPSGFADSYDAVYGDSLAPLGARFEWNLHPRFALSLSTTFVSSTGELVAILPGEPPQPTGIESKIELNPWHLTAAWRIHPDGPWSGYVGIGPTFLRYSEKNEFDDLAEDKVGAHLSVGLRRSFGRFVIGAEALYSSVTGIIGDAGAAAAFGEDDLGGITGTVLLGYAF